MRTIKLGSREITKESFQKPYIIAEAGVNHEGDLEKARLMIEQAARAGADAVKFQTYKAETLAAKSSPAYWDTSQEATRTQYELFKKYDSFWVQEFRELRQCAANNNIDFLSTPFDFDAADILEDLVPFYKIASADITNHPFIRHIALKGKPVVLSTGASTVEEIWEAVRVIEEVGNKEIVLLHCVLNYPTKLENANLGMIGDMNREFPEYIIGYSDHTLASFSKEVLCTAWLLGAGVIEKHFTFDKSLPGNDHYHAMDEDDLAAITSLFDFELTMMGKFKKEYLPEEEVSRQNARRSLVATRRIRKGEILQRQDVAIKRPGTGLAPKMLDRVVGAKALVDIEEDEILKRHALLLSE
jgi:N-acetylneuraminate synthase